MRRTYLSKKEIGSALDSRDVLLNLDEKSSKFDAFYIQNIKQTRRELSCVGSSNTKLYTANKVRKRKYVKKVVPEKHTILKESNNISTCLTPDKSLHVNKELDLFDQLLNSSNHLKVTKKENLFDQLQCPKEKVTKPYKKAPKAAVKKFNCSSSDSAESEKENSTIATTSQNVTDIRKHELIIEKESCKPKKDESIFQIEQNLACINNIINRNDAKTPSPLFNKNRLTRNVVTSHVNSPLCSTPFAAKYRGKSIYNFSPIGMKDVNENESVNIETDEVNGIEKNNDNNELVNELMSPVIMCSKKKYKVNKNNGSNDIGQKLFEINSKDKTFSVSSANLTNSISSNSPFKGFSNNSKIDTAGSVGETAEEKVPDVCNHEMPGAFEIIENKNDLNNSKTSLIDSITDENNVSIDSQIQLSTTAEQFLGFSKCHNTEVVEIDMSTSSNEQENSDIRKSLYDTCCSIECDEITTTDNKPLPLVVLEKMNDTLFKKYYKNRPKNYDIEHENLDSHTSLLESSSDDADEMKVAINNLDEYVECDLSADSNEGPESHSEEEEKCVSFVTTRRRNEVIDDSMIMMLNNSQASTSSECDKTVISRGNRDTLIALDNKDTPVNTNESISSRLSYRTSFKPNETENVKTELKPPIVLQPGKKWERCLSIYRRMTVANANDSSLLDDDAGKGRKYRQSIINCMEIQENGPLHNDSFSSCRSTINPNPHRSTIRIVLESSASNISVNSTNILDDETGFLTEDCDDTVVQLSKLSIVGDRETTVAKFHDTSERLDSAKEYVLRRCNQTAPLLFDECYPDTVLKNCHKIGEGVYGEVFLWRAGDGRARVMKVVPVAGTLKVNGEHQKDFQEIIAEIVIAMELSALRAPLATIQGELDECDDPAALDLHSIENATDVFNEVLAVRCVYGCYPSRLLDLWELFDECKGSENDNPASLPAEQRYVVLELANAGQDLESYAFASAEQAYALLLQVAYGLAVGEESFQFEHRDLHWGNVLIAPTEQKYATFVLRGRAHRVPRRGVAATIIDYSLSRLALPLAGRERATLYNDLAADEGLFDAVGDYQFDVYRLMRDKLGNNWKNYEPYTNIIWLHYTVDKMITALRYRRTNTKLHKHYLAKLKGVRGRILDYGSATHFVLTDAEL